jgi:hypothetical protein
MKSLHAFVDYRCHFGIMIALQKIKMVLHFTVDARAPRDVVITRAYRARKELRARRSGDCDC